MMEKGYKKLKCAAYVAFCVITVCGGCSCSSGEKWTTDRPKDFPEIIVLPPNTFNTKYQLRVNEKEAGNAVVTCSIKKNYPAKSVVSFFENHFKDRGWVQLKHDPLNLDDTRTDFLNEWQHIERIGNQKLDHYGFQEWWVNPCNNDSIFIVLTYGSPTCAKANMTQLDINIIYDSEQQSRRHKIMEQYRILYPEEFDINQKATLSKDEKPDLI